MMGRLHLSGAVLQSELVLLSTFFPFYARLETLQNPVAVPSAHSLSSLG